MQSLFDTKSKFQMYHEKHPEIWDEFKTIALELAQKNIKHYGAKAIFEVIRYHRVIQYNRLDWKCNNNYTASYARKFMREFPEYDGFFELRKQKNSRGPYD